MTTRLPKFIFVLSIVLFLGFGPSQTQASPTRIVSTAKILQRLVILIGRLERLNYQVEDIHLAVVTRRSYRYKREFHAGHAYSIVGVGDERIRDLDISLYDENGYRVARDNDAQNIALARVRPSRTRQFTTKVDAYEFTPGYTDGFFAIITSHKRQTGRVVSTVEMLQRLVATLAIFEAGGYQTIQIQMGVLHKAKEKYRYNLKADRVYKIVGVGDQRIRDLDIAVSDENGHPIGKDEDPANVAIVTVRPRRTGRFRVGVSAFRFKPGYSDGFFVIVTVFK